MILTVFHSEDLGGFQHIDQQWEYLEEEVCKGFKTSDLNIM